jgi:isocitrate dehydrogenase kinase/phosphatase
MLDPQHQREDPAEAAARAVHDSFLAYHDRFQAMSQRARTRFETRNWTALLSDALERLRLYGNVINDAVADLVSLLGREESADRDVWRRVREAYAAHADGTKNFELARTFFNSITRRIFAITGVDPELEFVSLGLAIHDWNTEERLVRRYRPRGTTLDLIRRVLVDYRFDVPYADIEGDARQVAERVERHLSAQVGSGGVELLEVLRPVFYRNKAAYIIARVYTSAGMTPLILPLLHDERGVFVDAALMSRSQVSILFSFTRSYFHVDADCPRELIVFLKSIIPQKPVAELYIALGMYKHGKTELYRSLQRHLRRSTDRFEVASGDRGMVMLVFALPSYDRVFKLIRDRFDFPKTTTSREVVERYRLVFERDRVGRLVEAQRFEQLKFRRSRFSETLLAELRASAAGTVEIDDMHVTIRQLYTERKVRPLNLYIREVADAAAERAVTDYGRAIKELAAANIFPGDFLLKNFGVTRHGRVVFYDYDELCLVTDCNFRRLPTPRIPEDELAAEPWFTVGPQDIFPEEFRKFLGLSGRLREVFEEHHRELFTVEFWRRTQQRCRAGELLDFYPYASRQRLRH